MGEKFNIKLKGTSVQPISFSAPHCGQRLGRRDHTPHRRHLVCGRSRGILAGTFGDARRVAALDLLIAAILKIRMAATVLVARNSAPAPDRMLPCPSGACAMCVDDSRCTRTRHREGPAARTPAWGAGKMGIGLRLRARGTSSSRSAALCGHPFPNLPNHLPEVDEPGERELARLPHQGYQLVAGLRVYDSAV